MSSALAIGFERLIPMPQVELLLGCNKMTARRFCARHDIPITRMSRKAHGLTETNYRLLLSRATETQR